MRKMKKILVSAALCTMLVSTPCLAESKLEGNAKQKGSIQITYEVVDDGTKTVNVPTGASDAAAVSPKTGDSNNEIFLLVCMECLSAAAVLTLIERKRS